MLFLIFSKFFIKTRQYSIRISNAYYKTTSRQKYNSLYFWHCFKIINIIVIIYFFEFPLYSNKSGLNSYLHLKFSLPLLTRKIINWNCNKIAIKTDKRNISVFLFKKIFFLIYVLEKVFKSNVKIQERKTPEWRTTNKSLHEGQNPCS